MTSTAPTEATDTPKEPSLRPKIGRVFIRILVSAAIVALIIYNADTEALWQRLQGATPALLAAAALTILGQSLATAWRWAIILGALGVGIRLAGAARIVLTAFFLGQALPYTLGSDAVRIWLAHRDGVTVGVAARSVILDRISGLLGLVTLLALSAPLLLDIVESGPARAALLGGSGLVAAGLVVLVVLGRVLPALRGHKILEFFTMLSRGAAEIFASARLGPPVVAISALGHALLGVGLFFIARSMEIEISLAACIALMPAITLATMLPVSLGGWGLREAAMAVMLGFVGVSFEAAVAMSILFGGLNLAAAMPGGVLWLIGRRNGKNRTVSPTGAS